jgi:hypothetical protein
LPELIQYGFVHTKIGFGPFHFSAHNTGFLEYFKVLADGGLGIGKNAHDLSADTGIDRNEVLDDLDPGGMAQGLENFCRLFGFHGNNPLIVN